MSQPSNGRRRGASTEADEVCALLERSAFNELRGQAVIQTGDVPAQLPVDASYVNFNNIVIHHIQIETVLGAARAGR